MGRRATGSHLARVQAELRQRGKAVLRAMSPASRAAWMKTSEAIAALGAQYCHQLRKQLDRRDRNLSRLVCSGAWLDAYRFDDELPPEFYWGNRDHLLPKPTVKLVLSKNGVSVGVCPPTRRWTPEQAVSLEDSLDGLSIGEAREYHFPASPSAYAIQVHAYYAKRAMKRLADDRGRAGRGRVTAGKKKYDRQY